MPAATYLPATQAPLLVLPWLGSPTEATMKVVLDTFMAAATASLCTDSTTSRLTAAASKAIGGEDEVEETLVLLVAEVVLALLPIDVLVRPAGILIEKWSMKPVLKTRRPFDPLS